MNCYVTAHSPTLPSLYLRHSSFCNPSVASPTSQLIFQPFFRFSYVTSSSLNSPGEPLMSTIWSSFYYKTRCFILETPALAQMVAYLPLVQRIRGSIPSGVVNFHLKIFNLGASRGGDVHFLIAGLYITCLD